MLQLQHAKMNMFFNPFLSDVFVPKGELVIFVCGMIIMIIICYLYSLIVLCFACLHSIMLSVSY